ncbi:MAG: hypothetical protein KDI36_12380 [Pseudomonadales bacterium]|nr:hypothetical protein [Pseudomonadales bacterium]
MRILLLTGLEDRLGYAILGVFRQEPLPEDSPIWSHDRVMVTPHASNAGDPTCQRGIDLFVENLAAIFTMAIMLSGEADSGSYPVEAVVIMDRVAHQAESQIRQQGGYGRVVSCAESLPRPIWEVMANATAMMSWKLEARGIIVIKRSGTSAVAVISSRPATPVVGVTDDERLARRLNLLWGVFRR